MEGEGMVAVVRGLRDAGLAVTLLDSGRQYTLLPESASQPVSVNLSHTTASQCSGEAPRESAVQATDGRYASTYRMMHCHVTPTSPPDQVTEFPPQRAEIYPGGGNFEVGGQGSGENYCHPTRSSGFRGAMIWPDRGAIFSPRPSLQPDSFANSLRKYPSLSQERSSEIVERLINFTQTKNTSRNRPTTSPTRNIDTDLSTHTVPLDVSRQTSRTQRYDPEVHNKFKRSEESPTKDRPRKALVEREPAESWKRSTFSKTNDVRYLRDVSRKVRERIRSLSVQPNNQPERLVRERFDSSSIDQKSSINQSSTNSVNMEIQAAVQMVSREIVTVPRIVPSQRTVAVPLTPTSSLAARKSDGLLACSHFADLDTSKHMTGFVQTNLDPVDINIQTVLSAIEISNHKCRHRKRVKSQEEIRFNESIKNEILHLIQRLPLDPNYSASFKPHRKSHNRCGKINNINIKRVEDTRLYDNIRERRLERGISKMNSKYLKRSLARIFHAEVTPFRMTHDDDIAELIQDWINLIPLKRTDGFSINIDKESLFYELFEYIKNSEYSLKGLDTGHNLKTEIINILESIPLEYRGNRWVFENRLADILVEKINKTRRTPSDQLLFIEDGERRGRKSKFQIRCPSERELRNFVLKELSIFLKKTESKLNQRQIKEVENELIDLLSVSVELLRGAGDKHLIMNITELLVDYGVPEHKAIYFSNALLRRFRDVCMVCKEEGKIRSETIIVLSNTETVEANYNATSNSLSIKSINDDDIQANIDSYTKDLCSQIDGWLTQLPISIPQVFRPVVVNDLAGDIIDRHRYNELNPSSSRSEESELEHLKYQIFKWINKFVGDDNLETSKYAPDLMKRIKHIPVPMLSKLRDLQNADANNSEASTTLQFKTIPPYEKSLNLKTSPKDSQPPLNVEQEQQGNQLSIHDNDGQVAFNQTPNSESCSGITNKYTKTIEQLEEEYEKYVKDWVKLIPIEANTAEEQAVADKARLGIHNGIWKVVSKLNCDPATYYNRFFYEDLLDDGIEDLLDCLPQTPELQNKKHVLKSKLIGKTVDINDLIRANEEASFKHNLIKNIFSSLRKQGITRGDDPVKMYEDMQVKKIVEEFLLCINFKNDDKVKAEVFKKKLFKHIEDFIDDLKQHHPNELKDIDVSQYKTDIVNILLKVRLPREEIIKQEADSILLDLEIEQWCTDLPTVASNDYKEQYQRSKQREILAKKVKDFENDNNDFSENDLRLEVTKFLENAVLKEGENLNMNFMVDQFVNRIKNRPKQEITQNSKKVAFQTIPNYEDFSKDISFCSSFIQPPKTPAPTLGTVHDDDKSKPKQSNLSENKISPQPPSNRSNLIHEQPTYKTFNEGRPISSSMYSEKQWHTLEEAPAAPNAKMYTLPPYDSPKYRHTLEEAPAAPNANMYTLPPYDSPKYRHTLEEAPAAPNANMYTLPPYNSPKQWHTLEEAPATPNANMYAIPPYNSPKQWHTLEEAPATPNTNMYAIPPYNSPKQWHTLQEAPATPNANMYAIPPYNSPKQWHTLQEAPATPNANMYAIPPYNSPKQWHTLEEAPAASNVNMYAIPPYNSPEQRIPQRREQHSLQRPGEDIGHKTVVENKTCYLKTLDLDSETEQKQSTKGQIYPQIDKEHHDLERIKSSKGILGTSQVAGPSGYSSKVSANINSKYYKGEIYELPPAPNADPSQGRPCKTPQDSTTYKTKLYDDQMPQTTNECSIACQTYDFRPDQLREDNLIKKDDKQNACTNTSCYPPIYSGTPHEICPNIIAGPNVRRDKLETHDKSGVRRCLTLNECEEEDDDVPCRCIEKFFRRSKRHPCENSDNYLSNYPPYVPLLFPYPCFF